MNRAGFDQVAASYDEVATSRLGRILRARVHGRLEPHMRTGARVLDIGCGTGIDAAWMHERGATVTAIDASQEMVHATQARLGDGATVAVRDLNDATWATDLDGPFDLALSNFGVLNCVDDLPRFASDLAALLHPGATLIAVPMTRFAPWELAFAARARDTDTLRRRFRTGAVTSPEYPGVRTTYWTPRAFSRAFEPWFERRAVAALGALLPTYEHRDLIERRRRLGRMLATADRAVASLAGPSVGGDHIVVEMTRTARP